MVTMRDVAAAAGVSQATVSYAYGRGTGRGHVSEEQRARILAVAAGLGYAGPNVVGRSLRSGRVGAFGVMVMDSVAYALADPSTTLLLKGIVEVGELSQVALTLLPLSSGLDTGASGTGHPALRGLVDGLLVHSLPDGHPLLAQVVARGLPVVVIDAPELPGVASVGIEDRSAAAEQLGLLLDLGHRRLGVIADRLVPDGCRGVVDPARWDAAAERVVRERLRGYADACDRRAVDWAGVTVVEAGAFDRESGLVAARLLLDTAEVTGVVATSDVMALALLEVLAERGLGCPGDVSVVGFDDAPAAAPAGLTTVRQPMVEKGRRAAQLLLQQLADTGTARGDRAAQRVVLPTELVLRATAGPVPGR